MIATVFSLDRRIDLFAVADAGGANRHKAQRLVSYNNGESWVDNWIQSDVGVFESSMAAAITGDSMETFLTGRGMDDRFWFARMSEYYQFEQIIFNPIGAGTFDGKPAICAYGNAKTEWKRVGSNVQETTFNGVRVIAFGQGKDNKVWWAYSSNGGNSWDMAWSPVGSGVFTSSPAACCSADGKLVAVFAKGNDNKIWWAHSSNGAATWDMAWAPIGTGVFTSAPAACCSADGKRIYVFGRGNDNKIWWASTSKGTDKWEMAWLPIGEGVFTTMPSAACSWDGRIIHVFGMGNDHRIWQARSLDFGASWNIAWRKVHNRQFT